MRTTKGNSSQEDYKNNPFVVLMCRENKRHVQSRRTGIILERTRRRPRSLCSRTDRMRGAHKHNKQ